MNDDERTKLVIDYYKHLNTLSTGSIVLIGAFLEKLSKQPQCKWLAALSLIGFMLSVIGAVGGFTFDLFANSKYGVPQWWAYCQIVGLVLTWCGFLLGVAALVAFALINLW